MSESGWRCSTRARAALMCVASYVVLLLLSASQEGGGGLLDLVAIALYGIIFLPLGLYDLVVERWAGSARPRAAG